MIFNNNSDELTTNKTFLPLKHFTFIPISMILMALLAKTKKHKKMLLVLWYKYVWVI